MPGRAPRPERVVPPWRTLMLICSKCKGSRHGPSARDLRKTMKQRVGKAHGLRVLESECLSICPDHAITVCIVSASSAGEVCVVRTDDEVEALVSRVSE